jgi:hypothetical protein
MIPVSAPAAAPAPITANKMSHPGWLCVSSDARYHAAQRVAAIGSDIGDIEYLHGDIDAEGYPRETKPLQQCAKIQIPLFYSGIIGRDGDVIFLCGSFIINALTHFYHF